MLVSELVSLVRTLYLDDTVEPYLWSDEILTGLALQAEIEACSRANLLVNNTDYSIVTTANTSTYTLSPKIIKIITAELTDNNLTYEIIRKALGETGYMNYTGKPMYYSYVSDNVVRLYPIPDKEYTINLTVSLYPSTMDMGEFQIPQEFHKQLGYYVAANALMSSDLDATDVEKAKDFDAMFTRAFGSAKDAKSIMREKYYSNDEQVYANHKKFGFP